MDIRDLGPPLKIQLSPFVDASQRELFLQVLRGTPLAKNWLRLRASG